MTRFYYKAVDAGGQTSRGVIDAETAVSARTALRAKALLPLSIEQRKGQVGAAQEGYGAQRAWMKYFQRGLNGKTLSLITRQLATLLSNNVQIEDALSTIAAQVRREPKAILLRAIRERVVEGQSLAAALRASGMFPDQYVASVAAGEETGQLPEVLLHLADYVESEQTNRQTISLALVYPAFLALISGGIVYMLMTHVVPDIVKVYQRRGTDLPLSTDILIGVSGFLQRFGFGVFALLLAVFIGYRFCMRMEKVRLGRDRLLMRVPMFGHFTRKRSAAEFSGTLSMLVQSGVPLVRAMKISGDVLSNAYMRAQIDEAATAVKEGVSLDSALAKVNALPPMLQAMVASGTRSGELGTTLARAAEDQRKALDAEVKTLVSLIEPVVLVTMGGVVLLIVMAILTPIVNLNNLTGL